MKMNELVRAGNRAFLWLVLWCLVTRWCVQGTPNMNNTCPKEISNIPNSTDFIIWQSSGKDNEIVISSPPCLDKQEYLVTRVCYNHTWIPPVSPRCLKLWNDGCMSPYEQPINCDFITEQTTWETNCNVAKKSSYSNAGSYIWMPFKRQTEYGPYELSNHGRDYGVIYKNDFLYSIKDLFTKDCLVINIEKSKITAANCNEKHSKVCSRNTRHICPKHCIFAPNINKCYCKMNTAECKHPIEIRSPEEFLIVQELVEEEECYVQNNDSPRFHGVREYVGNGHWSYTDRSLNCSICSLAVHTDWRNRVEMFLSFYEESRELTLIIYSPLHLAYGGAQDYVYCFAGNPYKFRKRVYIEKVYNPPEAPPDGDIPFYVYKVYVEKYMNSYWCEAHISLLTEEMVVSNQILAYQEKNGYEYTVRLSIRNACSLFNCSEAVNSNFEDFVPEELVEVLDNLTFAVRVMDVIFFDFEKLDYVLHLTTETEQEFLEEYQELIERTKKLGGDIKIVHFRSSEFCLPQLVPTGTTSLNFPLAAIGQVVVPNELCLQKNMVPVVRMCEGDFLYGARWASVSGDCENNEASETTKYIHSVSNQNLSKSCVANVSRLVRKEDLSLVDVYYVSKILKKANDMDEEDVFKDSLDIVDGLMKVELATLKQAQDLLNTTDDILDSLEKFTMKPVEKTRLLIQKENYIIHITKPFQTNVSGVLLYYKNNTVIVEDFRINASYDDVKDKEYLKFAVQISFQQLNEWLQHNATTDLRIITTIFLDDKLFRSDSVKSEGPVVDVTVPGFGHYLKFPVQIWFKTSANSKSGICAFWDYGSKSQRHKGNWSGLGGDYIGKLTDASIDVCLFSHLTHFALLIINSHIEEQDEYILTVLTYIGDFLTIFGLTGIFATALMFENWRRRQGTKILLNLSAAIIMEDVVSSLLQSNLIGSYRSCMFIGPTLQYIVISKYCWMLVYAFLQYVRFVKVLGPLPTNIVFKSVLFGWGAPCVPVVTVCFFNPYSYGIKNYLYCYPKDVFLYIGLLIPICLIIVTNTVVFFIVMRNVTAKTSDVYSRNLEATSQKLQFQLATLLFFVLGLPMILGLLSNLIPIVWLQTSVVYLYCITSNLQGFMLFLFYVILNKETRNKWIHYYTGKSKLSLSISSKTKG